MINSYEVAQERFKQYADQLKGRTDEDYARNELVRAKIAIESLKSSIDMLTFQIKAEIYLRDRKPKTS